MIQTTFVQNNAQKQLTLAKLVIRTIEKDLSDLNSTFVLKYLY